MYSTYLGTVGTYLHSTVLFDVVGTKYACPACVSMGGLAGHEPKDPRAAPLNGRTKKVADTLGREPCEEKNRRRRRKEGREREKKKSWMEPSIDQLIYHVSLAYHSTLGEGDGGETEVFGFCVSFSSRPHHLLFLPLHTGWSVSSQIHSTPYLTCRLALLLLSLTISWEGESRQSLAWSGWRERAEWLAAMCPAGVRFYGGRRAVPCCASSRLSTGAAG